MTERDELQGPVWLRWLLIAFAVLAMALLVVMPLLMVLGAAFGEGFRTWLAALTTPDAVSALKLTLFTAAWTLADTIASAAGAGDRPRSRATVSRNSGCERAIGKLGNGMASYCCSRLADMAVLREESFGSPSDQAINKALAASRSSACSICARMALATRDMMEDLRAMGAASGGPKPFSAKDRSAFLQALDLAIQRLKRAGFSA